MPSDKNDPKDGFKIDLTSSTFEKAIESAQSFLEKLMMPAVEEVGLMMKEKVTSWRLKNQVRVLTNARLYCQKHNINPKAISLKLLVPLLENAGLEEDEFLQDKWAILLANMVDTDQNNENNVFPFILSQLSKNEFLQLEKEYMRIKEKLEVLEPQLAGLESQFRDQYIPLSSEREVYKLRDSLRQEILITKYISPKEFKPFEIANLVRCGLIKLIPVQYGYSRGVKVDNRYEELTTREIEIEIEHIEDSYVFTELGKIFFAMCSEKNHQSSHRVSGAGVDI